MVFRYEDRIYGTHKILFYCWQIFPEKATGSK